MMIKAAITAALLALLSPVWANVTYNNDAVWEQERNDNAVFPFTTPLVTLDAGLDGTGDVMLIIVLFAFNDWVGATCTWGNDATDTLIFLNGPQQGMWVFGLHEEDPRFTAGNSATMTCDRGTGSAAQTGIHVVAMTFDGVNLSAPVNACAGTCTTPGTGPDETLTVSSANLSGDAGDLILGFGDSFGATVPTCDLNGQSADGPFLFLNSHSCVMRKSWGGPQGDDIQFGNNDVFYGGVSAIVLNAAAAAGPSMTILRRRR